MRYMETNKEDCCKAITNNQTVLIVIALLSSTQSSSITLYICLRSSPSDSNFKFSIQTTALRSEPSIWLLHKNKERMNQSPYFKKDYLFNLSKNTHDLGLLSDWPVVAGKHDTCFTAVFTCLHSTNHSVNLDLSW